MAFTLHTHRDAAAQGEAMWTGLGFESARATIERRSILPVFDRYCRPGDRILEGGCGFGTWVDYLRGRGFRAVGIDTNAPLLSWGASEGLPLIVNDVARTCFRDGTFDAYLSLGVVEHFPEGPQAPLGEARRVLRRGGILLVSTPCTNAFRALVNHPARGLVNTLHRVRGRRLHFAEYRFTQRELVSHVRTAGFEVLETVLNDYRLDQDTHSIGFYTDWPIFRARGEKWRLNAPGRWLFRALKRLSPNLVVSGILVVARKP